MQKKLKGEVMSSKIYISIIRSFFLSCIFVLCTAFAHREPGYCKMAKHITKNFVKDCAIPRRLMLTGYGGAMMNDIQSVTLRFLSLDALNVDEARNLYVEIMEEFLRRINCYEKIRPHLHNYPFREDNIKLSIGFEDNEGRITQDGHVALMYIGKNKDLVYRAYSPDSGGFYPLHREHYDEALRLVQVCSNPELN